MCRGLHLKTAMLAFTATFLLTITANERASVLTLSATVLAFVRSCLHLTGRCPHYLQLNNANHFLLITWAVGHFQPFRVVVSWHLNRDKQTFGQASLYPISLVLLNLFSRHRLINLLNTVKRHGRLSNRTYFHVRISSLHFSERPDYPIGTNDSCGLGMVHHRFQLI